MGGIQERILMPRREFIGNAVIVGGGLVVAAAAIDGIYGIRAWNEAMKALDGTDPKVNPQELVSAREGITVFAETVREEVLKGTQPIIVANRQSLQNSYRLDNQARTREKKEQKIISEKDRRGLVDFSGLVAGATTIVYGLFVRKTSNTQNS